MPDAPARIVFGGTFNPPHAAHVRFAVVALELLAPHADGVDFVPGAHPPHKPGRGILPFALRCALVEAAIAGIPGMRLNRMEGEREGPSYTWETLAALRERQNVPPWFLVGSEDYAQLATWRRGLELPRYCRLAVAARGETLDADGFRARTRALWPGALAAPDLSTARASLCRMALPGGSEAVFLPLPHLCISASRIRELWLAGRNPVCLAPQPVLDLLERERNIVTACWRENS